MTQAEIVEAFGRGLAQGFIGAMQVQPPAVPAPAAKSRGRRRKKKGSVVAQQVVQQKLPLEEPPPTAPGAYTLDAPTAEELQALEDRFAGKVDQSKLEATLRVNPQKDKIQATHYDPDHVENLLQNIVS